MADILVVDDHKIVRDGIRQLLSEATDLRIEGEAGCAEDAMSLVRARRWSIILLDLTLPGMSGADAIEQIKAIDRDARILVLSMLPEARYASELLRRGAHGYIQKDADPVQLIRAIRVVLGGHLYISQTMAALRSSTVNDGSAPPHESLSAQESEVFNRIILGMTVTKTAQDMGISVKTVSTYRARIFLKMHMKTDADLIYYAFKQNLANRMIQQDHYSQATP